MLTCLELDFWLASLYLTAFPLIGLTPILVKLRISFGGFRGSSLTILSKWSLLLSFKTLLLSLFWYVHDPCGLFGLNGILRITILI